MIALLGPVSDPKLLCLSPRPPHIFDAPDSDVLSVFQSFDCYRLFLSAISNQSLDVVLATPVDHMQAYVFLSMAIYLFSNNLVSTIDLQPFHRDLFAKLDIIFASIPQNQLRALLQSRLSSIRAAWESFVIVAGMCKQDRFFTTMVDVGCDNHWFVKPTMGHTYLWLAVSMGLPDVVQRLLSIGCRPDQWAIETLANNKESVIVFTLENGDLKCANLLLGYCDVNHPLRGMYHVRGLSENDTNLTTFQLFSRHTLSLKDRIEYLRLFLKAGADLDQAFMWEEPESLSCAKYLREIIPRDPKPQWWPSILDYFFYYERPAFDEFAQCSQAFTSKVTRAGILLALEEGNLESYLSEARETKLMDTEAINGLLQTILVEQFIITDTEGWPRRGILEVVHALLDFGIDFPSAFPGPEQHYNEDLILKRGNQASFALRVMVKTQRWRGKLPEFMTQALQLLIDHGAVVTGLSLQDAVLSEWTDLLKFLIPYVSDLAKDGPCALAEGVRWNMMEAVRLLLGAGVDIDSEVTAWGRRTSILARALKTCDPDENESEIVHYLVGQGATFRLSKNRPHPSDLLESLLDFRDSRRPPLPSVRYVVEEGLERQDPLVLSSSMLELCYADGIFDEERTVRRAVFEYLFRKGARVHPGGVLAAWILLGGGTELFRKLLDAGAGIDCYMRFPRRRRGSLTPLQAAAFRGNEEIVLLLLKAGATVNAAAIGKEGRTELQAICSFLTYTPEEQARKIRIMKRLIDQGADINAAPAWLEGFTALQVTANRGDLNTAILLLQRGADVNAPPCKSWRKDRPSIYNALDAAAWRGRLDMVKLLLNANALSQIRGGTGYNGAIQLAEKGSHFAVADLIRQHAAENQSDEELRNPYLSSPPRD